MPRRAVSSTGRSAPIANAAMISNLMLLRETWLQPCSQLVKFSMVDAGRNEKESNRRGQQYVSQRSNLLFNTGWAILKRCHPELKGIRSHDALCLKSLLSFSPGFSPVLRPRGFEKPF